MLAVESRDDLSKGRPPDYHIDETLQLTDVRDRIIA